jgi:hypothetical protein
LSCKWTRTVDGGAVGGAQLGTGDGVGVSGRCIAGGLHHAEAHWWCACVLSNGTEHAVGLSLNGRLSQPMHRALLSREGPLSVTEHVPLLLLLLPCRCYNHLGWRFTACRPHLSPRTFWGVRRPMLTVPDGDS